VGSVYLGSGTGADQYTVTPSTPSVKFTSEIGIFDNSKNFVANVYLADYCGLNLNLYNNSGTAGNASLYYAGGSLNVSGMNKTWVIDVAFPGGLTSQLNLYNFNVTD
jgi:hypothetical protein